MASRRGEHELGREVELVRHLALPLLGQMGPAQHAEPAASPCPRSSRATRSASTLGEGAYRRQPLTTAKTRQGGNFTCRKGVSFRLPLTYRGVFAFRPVNSPITATPNAWSELWPLCSRYSFGKTARRDRAATRWSGTFPNPQPAGSASGVRRRKPLYENTRSFWVLRPETFICCSPP